MNLNDVVAGCISTVNPTLTVTIEQSTGYTTGGDGTQVPTYATFTANAQVQSLTFNDLRQIDGLNIQGERRAIYVDGAYAAVVRAQQKGGDLITLPDNSVWLVAMVLEDWSSTAGWVKLCCTRQVS